MHKILLSIAGLLVEITSPLSAEELHLEGRLGEWMGEDADPLRKVQVRWQACEDTPQPKGEMVYYPGRIENATWKMYQDGTDYYADMIYERADNGERMGAVLRANPAWDDFTVLEQPGPDENWHSLLEIGAGDLITRVALLETGALVIHAGSIAIDGVGVSFVGRSGAGKSTQLGLWEGEPGVEPINDDRICVRVTDQGPIAYGTPWGGTADIAINTQVPLGALVLLEQSDENRIERLTPAQAAPLMAPRTFLPYWDARLMAIALKNLDTILTHVPVYRLYNRAERANTEMVRSIL